MSAPADPPGAPPVPTKGDVFGFFLMVVGMFMAILDIQIVASSLPQIQAGISASIDQVTWVQTAYLVAEVVMIPLSGWLAKVMSTRWVFVMSSSGFTLMSVACAFAWDTQSMIAFRAVQGFIGGAMIPTVFAANYKLLPPSKRMLGTVIIGLTATVAPAAGPTLGGYITEHFSWHWLFLVNIVPGLIVTALVPLFVDIDLPDWKLFRKIDILGIVLIAGFLGSLEIVLDEGPREDWFQSDMILFFAVLSVGSAVLLIWRELTIEHPVLELHAFLNRNFTVGCILTFVLGTCMYGQSYILPQFLSRVRGFSSLQVGEVMAVTGAAMFVGAPITGQLGQRFDARKILFFGFTLVTLGLWLNTKMTTEVGFDQLLWPQIARGLGLVLCMVTITAAALGTLPTTLVGGGSGLFNVFRNMGGALGLAMINTQWDGRYDRHYWWMAESISTTDQAVADRVRQMTHLMASHPEINGDPMLAAIRQLGGQIAQQAAIMAWNDVFYTMAISFICATPLILLLAKPEHTDVAAH
ncbi:DHA2 family efflux MFS transporter permease subunit [Acidimangrovimonas pyrenivorans]|uniref:DHA2 family efflux MFS transporter permease subunit n=1 Tax=Acidimangrovimonas pyrenivorans TaxID=2030798 RepID=A0ABV7AFI7_9RHOB